MAFKFRNQTHTFFGRDVSWNRNFRNVRRTSSCDPNLGTPHKEFRISRDVQGDLLCSDEVLKEDTDPL